ncbi:hypothetical protein [Saccharothrix yanglingensis]|uniref:SH3 domain-containing protein n=1 Tax=Saccharothrix yanglingensis TaxID=659496 RepID=A0ABU0WZQ7_9PSEU|nr:hypothetical protein [Saccharothrix yanglingensis]MDQ2585338.1 hypothetical protein [Saccharothrix yanglingensis]
MSPFRSARAAIGVGALAAALFTGVAAPAQADDVAAQARETVCAADLYVRTDPNGAFLGTLYRGESFDVQRTSGNWAYGFAYGAVNRHGWVQLGWFC